MHVRVTKLRLALAGLVLVLGGVGIATLVGPLIESALATAGQLVNVSDPAAPNTARVDSSGALKTAGVDAPTLPRLPFSVAARRGFYFGAGYQELLGPTSATVAVTDLTIANYFGNTGTREVRLYEYSAPGPNSNCLAVHSRYLEAYDIPARESIHANFQTPLVLKPLASGEEWCLMAYVVAPAGDQNYSVSLSVGGFVPSGVFVPPSSPAR